MTTFTDILSASLTVVTALLAAITGGVYVSFSMVIMPALRSLPASEAIAAMQGINVSALRAPFMTVFFGGTIAAVALIVLEVLRALGITQAGLPASAPWRILGAALAFASFVITIVRNVPLNSALASALARISASNDDAWRSFDRPWTTANDFRAAAAVAGALVLVFSLQQ